MIDAMKMALEALKEPLGFTGSREIDVRLHAAITALRQAIREAALDGLAQTSQEIEWDTTDMAHRSGGLSVEQEPVAWMRDDGTLLFADGNVFVVGQAFYTAPVKREWVGLTGLEVSHYNSRLSGSGVAEEIEAKLKERNK